MFMCIFNISKHRIEANTCFVSNVHWQHALHIVRPRLILSLLFWIFFSFFPFSCFFLFLLNTFFRDLLADHSIISSTHSCSGGTIISSLSSMIGFSMIGKSLPHFFWHFFGDGGGASLTTSSSSKRKGEKRRELSKASDHLMLFFLMKTNSKMITATSCECE